MPKKKHVNPAESIAAQTKRRQAKKAISLPVDTSHRRLIHHEAQLTVVGPDGDLNDLSPLLCQPKLGLMLAKGLARRSETVGARSWQNTLQSIRGPVTTFLKQFSNTIEPNDIDESFWTAFLRFLNEPKSDGNPWAPTTRSNYHQSLKYCLDALRNDESYGLAVARLIDHSGFPLNPWPGIRRKQTPTQSLRTHELDRVIEACLAEIETIRQRVKLNQQLIEFAYHRLEDAWAMEARPDFSDPYICAAAIANCFPNRLPSLQDIFEYDHKLGYVVQHTHRLTSIRKILYNSYRDLVPFALLLASKTSINAESLLRLSWSQVQDAPRDKICITPNKDRSTEDQGETLAAERGTPGGASDVLLLLQSLTQRTRHLVSERDQDRMFIAVPMHGSSFARSFHHNTSGPSCDSAWKQGLASFIEMHGLPRFTLRVFRPTATELIYEQGGDYLDVQHKLHHKHPHTQYTHYTSDRVRRLSRDKIASTQSQKIHWVETSGRVDPRGRKQWDRHSSTRGFMCLDPKDSPRPGQKRGRLCSAYGECPSCPLMAAMPEDDYAVACYLSLRERINDAKNGTVLGPSWLARWGPILADLDAILAHAPETVLRRASRLSVKLPPIG